MNRTKKLLALVLALALLLTFTACGKDSKKGETKTTTTAKPTTESSASVTEPTDPTTLPSDGDELLPDEEQRDGSKELPFEIGGVLEFDAQVKAGSVTYYDVLRVDGTILTLESADATIEYDGKMYEPVDGVISFPVFSDDVRNPIKLAIGNVGAADATFHVTFAYPKGTQSNPHELTEGDLVVTIEEGNESGVVYLYTAPEDGTFLVRDTSITKGQGYDIEVYNLNSGANRTLNEDGEERIVSVAATKGDEIRVTFTVLPDDKNEYPSAILRSTVNFTAGAVEEEPEQEEISYTVTVQDNEGTPIENVQMTFEVGGKSVTAVTNGEGVAIAQLPAAEGTVTITVPLGYIAEKFTYGISAATPAIAITMEKDVLFFPEEPEEPTTTVIIGTTTGTTTGIASDPTSATVTTKTTKTTKTTATTKATTTKTTVFTKTTPNKSTTTKTDATGKPTATQTTKTTKTTKTTTTKVTTTTKPTTTTTKPGNVVDYSVTVVNGKGNPVKGVTVQFYSGSKLVTEQKVDSKGVASVTLDKGTYTIKLSGTTLKYDEKVAVVAASRPSVTLVLAAAIATNKSYDLVVTQEDETDRQYKAYYLSEGAAYVTLTPGERNYFMFEPTRDGTYRFASSNTYAKIGHFGTDMFVYLTNSAEVSNNAFTLSVTEAELGNIYVIGIDAATNCSAAVLQIVRVGDPAWSIEDEPTIEYKGSGDPKPVTAPAGLVDVDIYSSAEHHLVFNKQDGYYHLDSTDGPVVYLRMNNTYASIEGLLNEFGNMTAYLYNADGSFKSKEQYAVLMQKYMDNMDWSQHVYPLTKDLEYMIRNYGDSQNWWNEGAAGYLFEEVEGVNPDNAWMFLYCCKK